MNLSGTRLLRVLALTTSAVAVAVTATPPAAHATPQSTVHSTVQALRLDPEQRAAAARAQARRAAAEVRAVQARLQVAQAEYAAATQRVGQQVSTSVLADTRRVEAQQAARAASNRTGASARALYASGGQAGLLNSVLTSQSLTDLAARVSGVRRVLTSADAEAARATALAGAATRQAASEAAGADAAVVTAAELTERAAEVAQLLASAQRALDRLSAQARSLTEAAAAARALAQARARAAAAQATAVASVRAQVPPADFFTLYRAAATTCRGMDWTLLAAVGQVESGHGRNVGPSSAGAIGAMQFMPATFRAFAVDGDRDGKLDPYSSADSVYSAARYLCSNGAGRPDGIQNALFRYNRAQWYVDLVLNVQSQLRAQQP